MSHQVKISLEILKQIIHIFWKVFWKCFPLLIVVSDSYTNNVCMLSHKLLVSEGWNENYIFAFSKKKSANETHGSWNICWYITDEFYRYFIRLNTNSLHTINCESMLIVHCQYTRNVKKNLKWVPQNFEKILKILP